MIKSAVTRTPILAFILMFFALGYTVAHNKVVVVPLGADAGVSGYEVVQSISAPQNVAAGDTLFHVSSCPSGKKVLGGGVRASNSEPFKVTWNEPSNNGGAWGGEIRNTTASPRVGQVIINFICANTID